MPFEGDTLPSDWVLADVHLDGLDTKPDELNMFWHADGALALFPISPGRYRVIADVGDARTGRAPAGPDPGRGPGDPRPARPGRRAGVGAGLAGVVPHQRAQGAPTTAPAGCSSPATPPTSTAPPAGRA